MDLSSILVSFVLYLGLMLPAMTVVVEKVNVIPGQTIVLPCLDNTGVKMAFVIWNHDGKRLLQHFQGKLFKEKCEMCMFVNKNFSLKLQNAKAGLYTCEVDRKDKAAYEVNVWEVTGSKDGYVLQGGTIELNLSPSNIKDTRIEWLGPHETKVTGRKPRWKLQKNNQSLQITNLTVQEDHGRWECHIFPDKLKIPYDVKVLGFSNALDEFKFTAINSNIILSCPLNINVQEEKNSEIPKVQSWKWVKDNIVAKEQKSVNVNNSIAAIQVSKVHFEDAGRYQCNITFENGNLSKSINLVVMKVSADHAEFNSKEQNVTLCAHINPSAPPMTELCWVHANDSMSEPNCGSPNSENKFCHTATTAGLWRCDLKLNNTVKFSINYTLAKFQGKNIHENTFPLREVASGAGTILLLIIIAGVCTPIWKTVKRKQQQAKKMAQIKQHLLAKRTCQCQKQEPKYSTKWKDTTKAF